MVKKTFAFAIALLMALSGFTAVAAGSDESDAAPAVQLDKGDAWGAGGHLDVDMLLDILKDELEQQDIVLEIPLEKEELLDFIENLVNGFLYGYELSGLDFDVSGDTWTIAEVVEKNASGYVVEFVSADTVQLMLEGKLTGMLPGSLDGFDPEDLDDGEIPGWEDLDLVEGTLNLKGLKLSSNILVEGKLYLDPGYGLTRADVSVNVGMTASAESNVGIDSEGTITYGDDIVKTTFVTGCDIDCGIAVLDGAIKFLPDDETEKWTVDREINVSVHGNAYADMPGDMEDYSEGFNDSENMDLEFDVSCSAGPDNVYTVEISDTNLDIPDEYGVPFVYMYPFENNEVPDVLLVGDSLRLDPSEKKTVRDNIGRISGDFGNAMADMDCTVTFVDDEGDVIEDLTQTVKYGKTITLPGYPSTSPADADEVFIGWESDNDVIWKNEYPVKYDMTLEAEFADRVTDGPDPDDFLDNTSVIWEATVDSINKKLDNSLFTDGRTLYITVSDADSNVLYKWRIGTGTPGETVTGTEMYPEIKKLETPDKPYLKEAADGRETVYLDFMASGTMPSKTVVSYYVGDVFEDGERVTIYYDNAGENSAVNSGSSVVIGGYVDIPLKHCSSYMLVSEGSPAGESGSNMMLVAGVVAVLVVAVAAAVLLMRKRNSGSDGPADKP